MQDSRFITILDAFGIPGKDETLPKDKNIPVSIAERIKQFNNGRSPVFTAMKYQVMAENPFRFLRGSCHLFYEDLYHNDALPHHPLTWISGDLHLENFGTYKGDNRLVYFDLNDFDEGLLAPATWEIARMVTSIFTGLDSLNVRKKEATEVARLFLNKYASILARGKARYLEIDTADGIVRLFMKKVSERRQKDLIRQRTEVGKNGKLQLRVDRVRMFPVEKELRKELMSHMGQCIRESTRLKDKYKVLDVAYRVAGTGSLGIERYVFLVRNTRDEKKHLLIDMKQAQRSSLGPWVRHPQPAWSSEAARVVAIQERMQNIYPALLSVTTFRGQSFILKEMQPLDDKIDFLVIRDRPKDIVCVIEDMALLTASAQLRSAGRQGASLPDELIAFGADRHWQQGLLEYGAAYSEQVKRDYEEYFKGYKGGFFSA